MSHKEKLRRVTNTTHLSSTTVWPSLPSDNTSGFDTDESFEGEWTDSRDGDYLPDWRSRIENHENATTAFSGTMHKDYGTPAATRFESSNMHMGDDVYPMGNITKTKFKGRVLLVPTGSNAFPPVPAHPPEADNEALVKFYSNWRSTIQTMSTGTFLGELRETIHQVRHPAESLVRYLSSFVGSVKRRTRGVRGARKVQKAVAGTWLEYSFGLKPLLHDLDDAARTLADFAFRPDFASVRAEQKFEELIGVIDGSINIGSVYFSTYSRELIKGSVRYKGQVRLQSGGGVSQATQAFGLSAAEIIPTIYQLIPYSFLVDYFSNLGDVIDAYCLPRASLLWVYRTIRTEYRYEAGGRPDEGLNAQLFEPNVHRLGSASGTPGSGLLITIRTDRTPFHPNELPLPDLQLKMPDVGSRKWLNIGALVALGHQTERGFHL